MKNLPLPESGYFKKITPVYVTGLKCNPYNPTSLPSGSDVPPIAKYVLEPLNNTTLRHVFLAFQTIKIRHFVLKWNSQYKVQLFTCLQNGYKSAETTVSKTLSPAPYLCF